MDLFPSTGFEPRTIQSTTLATTPNMLFGVPITLVNDLYVRHHVVYLQDNVR
jgi:hypothetical protein